MKKHILIALFIVSVTAIFAQKKQKLSVQTGHSLSINSLSFSETGSLLASAGNDNSIVLWDVRSGRQVNTFIGHKAPVNCILIQESLQTIFSVSDDGNLHAWDINTGKITATYSSGKPIKSLSISSDLSKIAIGSSSVEILDRNSLDVLKTVSETLKTSFYYALAFGNTEAILAFGGKKTTNVTIVNIEDGKLLKKFKSKSNSLMFSEDDTQLISAGVSGKIKKWNWNTSLPSLKAYSLPARRIFDSYTSVAVNKNGTLIAAGNQNNQVEIYSLKNGKTKYILKAHQEKVNALAFSNNGNYLATAGNDHIIALWDISTGHLINSLKGEGSSINSICLSNDESLIFTGHQNGYCKMTGIDPNSPVEYIRLKPKGLKKLLKWKYKINIIEYNDSSKSLFINASLLKEKLKGDKLKIKETTQYYQWNIDQKSLKTLKYHSINNNGDSLLIMEKVVLIRGNQLEVKEGVLSHAIPTSHRNKINAIAYLKTYKQLITAGDDGIIKFIDFANSTTLADLVLVGSDDKIYITPNNYYLATKGALKGVSFTENTKAFSFEQFDLVYNRPDKVLENLKLANVSTLELYKKAYEKRLQKIGKHALSTNTENLPLLTINDSIPFITKDKNLTLFLTATSSIDPLASIVIKVNGVPLTTNIACTNAPSWKGEVQIPLSLGKNEISIKALSTTGLSSMIETIKIKYDGPKTKPNLYLVSIGVSNYEQSKYNLKYAHKDATDIISLFKKDNQYNKTYDLLLTNENVTKEKIATIPAFLKGAKEDDVVLIFLAGHGVLDKNLDFYFASYDIDFNNPPDKGIPYAQIELLLDQVKSRKKILFLDACHSGDFDKTEVELTVQQEVVEDVMFRSSGNDIKNNQAFGGSSTYELSKMLFADLGENSGSHIISSAGGTEYAIEGESWKNGIFTYSLLNGLKSKKADENGDNEITVKELRKFIFAEVQVLSKGKQQPTSRTENISSNFIIWK